MDVRRKDWKQLEEDPMAKREDSILLFDKHRDAAIIVSFGNIPAIRHFLQHSRRSARRFIVLCSDEGQKASVKLDEIVIYWERKLPTLLVLITHLFVVSSRQRSKNQGFGDRLRCE